MFQIVINFSSEEKKDFVQKFYIQLFLQNDCFMSRIFLKLLHFIPILLFSF